MRINLTQHTALPEQECQPRTPELEQQVKSLLTFEELPTLDEIAERAKALTQIAADLGAAEAMIGGAPYLMIALDPALRMAGVQPVYAFSLRHSIDELQPDGSVVKRSAFKHCGFVRF